MADNPFDRNSEAVRAHLGFSQSVISRMALDSVAVKTWCITIVSAVLVLVSDKGNGDHALIALVPAVAFLFIDTYYLALERRFSSQLQPVCRQAKRWNGAGCRPICNKTRRRFSTRIRQRAVLILHLAVLRHADCGNPSCQEYFLRRSVELTRLAPNTVTVTVESMRVRADYLETPKRYLAAIQVRWEWRNANGWVGRIATAAATTGTAT